MIVGIRAMRIAIAKTVNGKKVKVCKGGDKYKVILKVSKKLWTKSEFTKH